MTNKKYLKENNLYESHKQFMRLCEWSYVPKTLDEDEEDLEMPPNEPLQEPPSDDNGEMMNGETDQQNMPSSDEQEPPMDDMSQGDDMDFGGEDEAIPNDDEEVIDVDDLTNAQEELNDKLSSSTQELGQVDSKISSLLQAIEKMESMISNNNNQIQSLKSEFEKRNPTQTEKLNLRALDSYPYNIQPQAYWNEKSANSNYSAYGDNDKSTTEEYKITNNDVDDFNDNQMNDSFKIDDDMNQDLNKIFNLK